MHCGRCCLRLAKNKDGTAPKHYSEATSFFFGWSQKVCPGSGGTDYVEDGAVSRCRRRRSEMRCPACGLMVTAKKDGRVGKHDYGGRECAASRANR